MATSRKKTPSKKPSSPKSAKNQHKNTLVQSIKTTAINIWRVVRARQAQFLARRPHRSFKMTRRRDYARSLSAPGYIAFTLQVNRTLRTHWKLFVPLIIIYSFIMVVLGAITSQDVYATINGLLSGASENIVSGGVGQLGQAALIALASFASSGTNLSAEQSVYLGFSLIFAWLATVWLLREITSGRKPKLRDGLYNSGAPILSTVGVLLVGVLQLLPIGIVMLMYAGLSAIGVLSEGFGAMLFWLFAAAVAALVLYWMTSTLIALVVVTIPGMYPLRAVRFSGDLVVGRRLRILLRLVWGLVVVLLTWALVVIGSIAIDNLIKMAFPDAADFSLVPYVVAIVSAFMVVWFAAYVYLFYRKVVDDDAKPA